MKESILLEAISMYEDKGSSAIEEINRTTAIYEYSLCKCQYKNVQF